MTVPPPPPLADVLDALQHVMLPAAGASAFVFAAVLLLGRRAANPTAALAVVAGLVAGNWEKVPMPAVLTASAWTHLPPYTVFLLILGFVTQLLTDAADRFESLNSYRTGFTAAKWPTRAVMLALGAGPVIPAEPGFDRTQFYALFVVGSVALWFTLDRLAECGFPAEVAALMGVTALLAGGVMLYAHSAKFLDMATILGSALLGVAVVAGSAKADARGAIPAFVGLLPGLLVSGRALTTSEVPAASFLLAAVAPLALVPWLVPNLGRRQGPWPRVLRAASVLAVLVVALVLAGRVETLPWEQDW